MPDPGDSRSTVNQATGMDEMSFKRVIPSPTIFLPFA